MVVSEAVAVCDIVGLRRFLIRVGHPALVDIVSDARIVQRSC